MALNWKLTVIPTPSKDDIALLIDEVCHFVLQNFNIVYTSRLRNVHCIYTSLMLSKMYFLLIRLVRQFSSNKEKSNE